MNNKVKAITIMEPFATLIAHGVKTIETRSWKTNLLNGITNLNGYKN